MDNQQVNSDLMVNYRYIINYRGFIWNLQGFRWIVIACTMECVWICKGDPFWFYPSVTWIPIRLDLGKRRIEPTDQQGVSPILVVKC